MLHLKPLRKLGQTVARRQFGPAVGGAVDAAWLVAPHSVVPGTIDQVSVSYTMMCWVLGIFFTPGYRFDFKRNVTDGSHPKQILFCADSDILGEANRLVWLVQMTGATIV